MAITVWIKISTHHLYYCCWTAKLKWIIFQFRWGSQHDVCWSRNFRSMHGPQSTYGILYVYIYTVFEFTIHVCKINQIICMRQMCRPLLAWHMAKWQRDPTCSLFQLIHLKIALLYTYPKRCRQVQSEFCTRLYRGYSGFKYILYPIDISYHMFLYIYIYIHT